MKLDDVSRTLSAAEAQYLQDSFAQRGQDFEFVLLAGTALGYYIEPWTNECLTGLKLMPDQPRPVSLDRSDEEIIDDEASIRRWIEETAHSRIVWDIAQRAPARWSLAAHGYFDDWSEIEFGASVLLFTVGRQSADVASEVS